MRRALLAVLVGLAGCGGGQHARVIADKVAPPDTNPVRVTKIAGTNVPAAEVAAQAVGAPLNGGVRPELGPVPAAAFTQPIARYRTYSGRQATAMAAQVATLQRALHADDRAVARRAWAGVYDRWLRVGAAYGSLGDLDAAITDGRRRLERGLWSGESLRALEPAAARLAADVRELQRTLPRVEITPLDYAIRAHEILEDAQRDMLSGEAAPYSGAGVRATAASLAATDAVVATLQALLAKRGVLAPTRSGLDGLRSELARIRQAHGGRLPALDDLTRRERQLLTGRLGAGLEILAKVPGALETQLPPAIPEIHP